MNEAVADQALTDDEGPVLALERAAMALYRQEYPEGPPWQELALETRCVWMREVEEV